MQRIGTNENALTKVIFYYFQTGYEEISTGAQPARNFCNFFAELCLYP